MEVDRYKKLVHLNAVLLSKLGFLEIPDGDGTSTVEALQKLEYLDPLNVILVYLFLQGAIDESIKGQKHLANFLCYFLSDPDNQPKKPKRYCQPLRGIIWSRGIHSTE
eukprot:TRINITY_DN13416_c0_g1_i1.p1 TRINITY_DN13416_c0_g1~~TRINITY_DN13416_c0_g1_i1.p1  ORF type:complete len:108 (+),score=16.71 TRINITY_DN13416_c0_g1_i1:132-455(+)